MSLLKLTSVLLDYPQDELWEHEGELLKAADEAAAPVACRSEVLAFVRGLLAMEPLDAQSRWLATFDRGRSMSLLLFEHIHGESRDRGQAMVDLMNSYRKHGFELSARELPDYLPLLLEYLAYRPVDEAREWLQHLSHIIGLLAARATERNSPYTVLFELLAEYAGTQLDLETLRQRVQKEERDDTPEAIDRVWEEEAVRFGAEAPPQPACQPYSRARPDIRPASQQVQP